MKKNHQGQSLSEYGLAFGLVVVAAIAGVAFLGGQGQQALNNSNQTLFVENGNGPLNRQVALLSSYQRNIPGTTPVNITLSNGKTITLQNYPSDLAQAIETLGADGTTNELIANLRSLARQMKDNNEISEAEYNQMEVLANQGHRLATIQKLLSDAAKAAKGDKARFNNSKINFEGKVYSPFELNLIIGISGTHANTSEEEKKWWNAAAKYDPATDAETFQEIQNFDFSLLDSSWDYSNSQLKIGDELRTLIKQYGQLEQQLSGKAPAVQTIVSKLTTQLAQISKIYSDQVWQTQAIDGNFANATPDKLDEATASIVSHQKSASICEQGNGTDSGIHCPKTQG